MLYVTDHLSNLLGKTQQNISLTLVKHRKKY